MKRLLGILAALPAVAAKEIVVLELIKGPLLFAITLFIVILGFLVYYLHKYQKKHQPLGIFQRTFRLKEYKSLKNEEPKNLLVYLLAAAFLMSILTGLFVSTSALYELSEVDAKIPEIRIRDGAATISEDQPYYVVDEFIIDTTGETQQDAIAEGGMLLTKTEAIVVKKEGNIYKTEKYDFKEIEEFDFTEKLLKDIAYSLTAVFIVMAVIFGTIFTFVAWICYLALLSVAGLLVKYFTNPKTEYRQMLGIMTVIFVPTIYITLVMGLVLNLPSFTCAIIVLLLTGYVMKNL